jgi:hypothetical protein
LRRGGSGGVRGDEREETTVNEMASYKKSEMKKSHNLDISSLSRRLPPNHLNSEIFFCRRGVCIRELVGSALLPVVRERDKLTTSLINFKFILKSIFVVVCLKLCW